MNMRCGKTKGDFTKSQVIILKQDGKRYLKLPKSTINDIWKRYKEIGSTNTKQVGLHFQIQGHDVTTDQIAPQLQVAYLSV